MSSRPASDAASRCGFITAAGVRCRRDEGHAGAHDTLYIFDTPDALPERPEWIDDPLPEDLERLFRDPEIVIDRDADVAALIADHLRRNPEVETVPRGAYLIEEVRVGARGLSYVLPTTTTAATDPAEEIWAEMFAGVDRAPVVIPVLADDTEPDANGEDVVRMRRRIRIEHAGRRTGAHGGP